MKKLGLLTVVLAFISGCFLFMGQASASDATIAEMNPKEVAATVLVAGSKKAPIWKSFLDSYQNDGMKLSVLVDEDNTSVENNYSQPGTGTSYMFELDDADQGEVNDYTISPDGKYVYCYQQQFQDSAERKVSPFLVLPASKILAMQHSADAAEINEIANSIKIKMDD